MVNEGIKILKEPTINKAYFFSELKVSKIVLAMEMSNKHKMHECFHKCYEHNRNLHTCNSDRFPENMPATVLCKSNANEFRRISFFVLANF